MRQVVVALSFVLPMSFRLRTTAPLFLEVDISYHQAYFYHAG